MHNHSHFRADGKLLRTSNPKRLIKLYLMTTINTIQSYRISDFLHKNEFTSFFILEIYLLYITANLQFILCIYKLLEN